jgi:hypothetical protein
VLADEVRIRDGTHQVNLLRNGSLAAERRNVDCPGRAKPLPNGVYVRLVESEVLLEAPRVAGAGGSRTTKASSRSSCP